MKIARPHQQLWRGMLASWLAFVTWVLLSADVSEWWGEAEAQPPASSAKPSVVQEALSLRPNTSEADTHLVLWAIASVLCCFAFRRRRARLTALGLLWSYGCLIEIMQYFTATRHAQWSDVLGNTIGISLGVIITMMSMNWVHRRRTAINV